MHNFPAITEFSTMHLGTLSQIALGVCVARQAQIT